MNSRRTLLLLTTLSNAASSVTGIASSGRSSFKKFSALQTVAASISTTTSSPQDFLNNRKTNISKSSLFVTDKIENQGLADIGSNSKMESEDQPLSLWRDTIKVSIAKSRKIRGGNFVQISSVDPTTLEPRIRTVVFRGFLSSAAEIGDDEKKDKDPCIMKMITDLRSSKVHEITKHTTSKAELLWWFSKSSEQYRVLGILKFVGSTSSGVSELDTVPYYQQARKQQWGNLSDSAREQFYWRDPKTSYETQHKVPEGGRDEEGNVLPPPDNFLLMLLFPERVDYLRLGDNYRQIDTLNNLDDEEKNGEWVMERVNP